MNKGKPKLNQYSIETQKLNLFYGKTPVLKEVNLQIKRGLVTSIIGPSGSGKTSFLTVLNRLTDLIPAARVDGSVFVNGENLFAPDVDTIQLRRRVGMIFQKPVPFPFSIQKNMVLPLREHGMKDRRQQAERVETVLRDVGLWEEVKDRLSHSAGLLSGGQQQRLCIARALALKPEILLMDEPCSALDPISTAAIESLIQSLKGRYTIVIVTHNLAQARRISDETAFFWNVEGIGQLVESAPTEILFEAPADPLTKAYVHGIRG